MYPKELFLGLHAYELCLILGMAAALLIADKMSIKANFSIALQRQLLISGAIAILSGLFGAVLFQAFYHYLETGTFSLKAGMTFYGGLLVGAGIFLIMWFFATKPLKLDKEAREKFPFVANMAAVLIPMAHGFGRIGCLFMGCCHGAETQAWYGVPHYDVGANGERVLLGKFVPIQLFEAIFLFALAGVLLWLYMRNAKLKKDSRYVPLLPLYMMIYGVWRFVIEYFRADERGETIVPFLTPSQLIAVLLIVGGIIYLLTWYFVRKRSKITEISTNETISNSKKEDENEKSGRDAGI
ncbi:MAG: prolipoprotein diacylglyceryl transferase [Clostridia bacterium]|nr:prolipoprotein diacylglyceryl transferase [Clostridia bacterium]